MPEMWIPTATYRLQLNGRFRFKEARKLVPYLKRLGISDIYSSPLLKSRQGSLHGYDVTDPTSLDPELGTEADFEELVEALKDSRMGLLLDIVPNHMAASLENPWWRDFQEKGKESSYAEYFDADWLAFGDTENYTAGYRRFFDIGDLVGVRVENPVVFQATHSLILRLIADGKITGLRIDHIDGLYDPLEYLSRLQEAIKRRTDNTGFYVVVEKILSGDETIPGEWPVSGTTGYEFVNNVNALFVDKDGIKNLDSIYQCFTGRKEQYSDIVYEKQKQVMKEIFPREMKSLGRYLTRLSGEAGDSAFFTPESATEAITGVTACLPVYRTYTRSPEVSLQDREYLEQAFQTVETRGDITDLSVLDFLRRVLLLEFPAHFTEEDKDSWLQFVLRWQQLTGAIMAKGVEDTALYNYHRLISLNEVGGNPGAGVISVDNFHNFNLGRLKSWPETTNTTSTHDTKRSEDVRARINVLSEIPGEWEEYLKLWQQLNARLKTDVKGELVPEPETEILLYQTMLGAWPLEKSEIPVFKQRLIDYMVKAVKEAKSRTSWINPDREYENALVFFIESIFDITARKGFLDGFMKFQKKIAYYGALNSLSQVFLKITSPGLPDFYQGTELWDFSLVDPDNRRPVDFKKRAGMLDELVKRENRYRASLIKQLVESWEDGRIKLFMIYTALNTRKYYRDVFQHGQYVPLKITGMKRKYVCAFARHYGERWTLTAVPRFFTGLSGVGEIPCGNKVWGNDKLVLPAGTPREWENVFTEEQTAAPISKHELPLTDIFCSFPVALLINI